jgi:ribosomal protein S3AE
MKKMKLIIAGFVVSGLIGSVAFADYNRGFKYYNKYIKRKAHIKSTELIKILDVNTTDDLNKLFENNASGLIQKLKDNNQTKAVKGVEKIIKKGKLKDLEDFLKGIMEGKIPAGCS